MSLAAAAVLALTLVACASAPSRPVPPAATPSEITTPLFGIPAQACLKEGESCAAAGSSCCAGLVCAGSRGPICITRF